MRIRGFKQSPVGSDLSFGKLVVAAEWKEGWRRVRLCADKRMMLVSCVEGRGCCEQVGTARCFAGSTGVLCVSLAGGWFCSYRLLWLSQRFKDQEQKKLD